MDFESNNIHGVRLSKKKKIFDDRGAIFHMMRRDDPEFQSFGEIYFSMVYLGVVKGWHIHDRMTLNYLVVSGEIRLVLFDDRKQSPTRGRTQEIILDGTKEESTLVTVPPLVWNGFKGLHDPSSVVANCATEPHDVDEIKRRPSDDPYFQYDWN